MDAWPPCLGNSGGHSYSTLGMKSVEPTPLASDFPQAEVVQERSGSNGSSTTEV